MFVLLFLFFKQKPAYEMLRSLVGSEMCIRDSLAHLAVFQQSRYAPYFRQVRQVIDSGVLGRIVQISISFSGHARRWDWQTLQTFGGGSLNTTGAHFLAQALQLFGPGYPEVICCQLERTLTLGDAEDYVKLVFRGPDAPTVDIEINSCAAYPPETWQVLGTRGGLAIYHWCPADGEYEVTISGLVGGGYVWGVMDPFQLIVTVDGDRVFQGQVGGEEDLRAIDVQQAVGLGAIDNRFRNIKIRVPAGRHSIGLSACAFLELECCLHRDLVAKVEYLALFNIERRPPGGHLYLCLQVRHLFR